ncbi:hypothetical protein VNO77_23058 [Canavalia gladiata]|uniref:Uncharacterized protein n=1 Tax=Canavalia gladiata TaxID=3824 RepID=A0AAN9L4P3_CANGL
MVGRTHHSRSIGNKKRALEAIPHYLEIFLRIAKAIRRILSCVNSRSLMAASEFLKDVRTTKLNVLGVEIRISHANMLDPKRCKLALYSHGKTIYGAFIRHGGSGRTVQVDDIIVENISNTHAFVHFLIQGYTGGDETVSFFNNVPEFTNVHFAENLLSLTIVPLSISKHYEQEEYLMVVTVFGEKCLKQDSDLGPRVVGQRANPPSWTPNLILILTNMLGIGRLIESNPQGSSPLEAPNFLTRLQPATCILHVQASRLFHLVSWVNTPLGLPLANLHRTSIEKSQ